MCSQVPCSQCHKPSWRGCGMHVSMALGKVELKDRCPNWKKGASQPCTPGQEPDLEPYGSWLPSFMSEGAQKGK
ncbi:hypothetical protein IV203_032489 [Nitzschia inconspicua]|uniref:Uncharacterized protein n=1 Tax=Nitzschia inconspicua TaxID=303405 RepID=A0A9K3KLD7_9STRA|nr:hypothetical protein IV203_032489 [Nitzschia inconspicua]